MSNEKSKPEDYDVRPMKLSDLTAVTMMEIEIFPDPWPGGTFVDWMELPEGEILVVEKDKIIIAYAVYSITMGEAHLANIAVAPEFRGKSIAKSLLSDILKTAKENKCEYIFLDVRPSNSAAIRLYKKFGFYELYRNAGYYKTPTEDSLVMVKNLQEGNN